MRTFDVAQTFTEYYISKGHRLLPSSSLLHASIPMSFVMSAGLVQIETAIAEGHAKPGDKYVLIQKCFRHFDLETAGTNNIHLSLFEMPGAFSFGIGNKADTVAEMWYLLTQMLGLPSDRLWVTYFVGGTIDGHLLESDQETLLAWQAVGLDDAHIVGLGADDNFWKQGGGIEGIERYRKCGPNTEVFLDRGESAGCGVNCHPGCRCGRFVEFANALFVHWEMDEEAHTMRPLLTPFNETVIGTERVAMILQHKSSVYEIDSIYPLIQLVRSFYAPMESDLGAFAAESEQVLADHIRALTFLVADGAPAPGKGGRRRLMRKLVRGVLSRLRILQIADPTFLGVLIEEVVSLEKGLRSDLTDARPVLLRYFAEESQRFDKTLGAAQRQLDKYVRLNGDHILDGRQVVCLEKQFGFPIPLLRATAATRGLYIDWRDYHSALTQFIRRETKHQAQAHS